MARRKLPQEAASSAERDEHGAFAPHAGSSVLDGLVGDGELGQVVADHLRLDLDVDVLLAVVDSNDASDHLWHNHHVAQVSLHGLGLLAVGRVALGLAELLEHGDGLALDATAELAALARSEQLHQVLVAQVQEFVEVNSPVGVLAESALLLVFFSILGHFLDRDFGLEKETSSFRAAELKKT